MKTKISNKNVFVFAAMVMFVLVAPSVVFSHCQIPCGIYDDDMRFEMMREHIKTIEKSMKLINQLSAENKPDMNQLVRWVQNKDTHADKLADIITQYFMAQRIKPVDKTNTKEYDEYVTKLTLLHQMLVTSMKTKQSTDLETTKQLKALVKDFEKAYQDKHEQVSKK